MFLLFDRDTSISFLEISCLLKLKTTTFCFFIAKKCNGRNVFIFILIFLSDFNIILSLSCYPASILQTQCLEHVRHVGHFLNFGRRTSEYLWEGLSVNNYEFIAVLLHQSYWPIRACHERCDKIALDWRILT